jgi:2-dehydro-3-deoxygluconokinase
MNLERAGPILCFGEVLVRLSTATGRKLCNANEMAVHVGGAESNVAALLSQLGHEVEMITALPSSALGDLCVADLRRHGIGTRNLMRAHGRVGLYFFEPNGSGGRIIYDRGNTVFAAHAGAFDWPALAAAARWFHLSGISLALGGAAASSACAAVSAMNEAGVPVSFDVNHRASLWEGKSEAELAGVHEVAGKADVLFASPFDISRLLGTDLPSSDADDRSSASQAVLGQFDRLQLVASTRRLFDKSGQQLAARIDTRAEGFETNSAPLTNVVDRIGSGDAFAGATIDFILGGGTPEQCANAGLAAAVSKHGIAGDRWIGTRQELEAFDPFGTGDVRR